MAPRRAAILIPSFAGADATTHDALGMAEALRAGGWEVRLFSGNRVEAPGVGHVSEARPFLESAGTLAIHHGGARWDEGFELLRRTPAKIVFRDHNITPPHFFEGVSAEFVEASRQGDVQRTALVRDPRTVRTLPASSRNASDLVARGAAPEHLRVVPPFHRTADLHAHPPDPDALRAWQTRPAVLFVGRLAPNKGHLRLLQTARAYHELFGAPLPMRLVGFIDPRHAPWTRRIEAERRSLPDATWCELAGVLRPSELVAAYLTSSVFLCCSEHEGFCVPLVEAASFGVPIVALREPGVAETLGEDGLLLDQDESPDVIATTIHRLLHDAPLRERLAAQARERIPARFSVHEISARLHAALEDL